MSERTVWAVVAYRTGQWLLEPGKPLLRRVLRVPYGFVLTAVQAATGVEIVPTTAIGPGLRIYHGTGLVVNSGAVIGARAVLRQGVTIGAREAGGREFPVIGDGVEFGAYAQVFGGVRVGDGARIGSLSVVLSDVPAGCTAVGAPARVIAPKATV